MNIAKKSFCRIYQTCFHLALPVLPYRKPQIIDSVKKLPHILKEDIPKMARHADREGNPLYPVPVLYDRKKLMTFYEIVADWSENNEN